MFIVFFQKVFTIKIPSPWLISLVFDPILRNLKEKMRGGRSFFRVEEGGGEEESVLMDFE